MSANNNFVFVGNLCNELKLSKSSNDKEYTVVSLAINSAKDKPDFISIFVWGKLAETIVKYCKKGDCIAFEGYVSTSVKDKHTSYIFNATDAKFIYKAKRNEEAKTKEEPKKIAPENDVFSPAYEDPFANI